MGYTEDIILDKCEKAFEDIKNFYKQPFINYGGYTTDTNKLYTEVVAEFLCNNLNKFINGIPQITRENSYKTPTHFGDFDINTPREEERIAMEMFKQSKSGLLYNIIGEIFDYQTPLKNKRTDIAGKIDLLSYDGRTVRVLELKKPDSEESMLRCVLEGFTYLKTLNIEKLLKDFDLPTNTIVKASPFVFSGKAQHKEMLEKRPWLFKLMKLLDSKPYYIFKEDNVYKVEG